MKRKYPAHPVVGVGAVLVRNGEILLAKRGAEPGRGKWSIPGGLVELGEEVRDAVVREVIEECNLKVEVDQLIDVVDNIVKDEKGQLKYHFVVLDFFVQLKGGTLKAADDVLKLEWAPLEKVEEYDLTKMFHAFFNRNLRKLENFSSLG
ncbi:MAG: NUDIX hydrolase [Thermoproteota archaeon]|nr:NUDIX hydrolase [Thermoproteota archaeon]